MEESPFAWSWLRYFLFEAWWILHFCRSCTWFPTCMVRLWLGHQIGWLCRFQRCAVGGRSDRSVTPLLKVTSFFLHFCCLHQLGRTSNLFPLTLFYLCVYTVWNWGNKVTDGSEFSTRNAPCYNFWSRLAEESGQSFRWCSEVPPQGTNFDCDEYQLNSGLATSDLYLLLFFVLLLSTFFSVTSAYLPVSLKTHSKHMMIRVLSGINEFDTTCL